MRTKKRKNLDQILTFRASQGERDVMRTLMQQMGYDKQGKFLRALLNEKAESLGIG